MKCREECDHSECDELGFCAICGLKVPLPKCSSGCVDADDNGICDKCRNAFDDGCDHHIDKNDDGVCDTQDCGAAFTDGCDNHRDADDDGVCDVVGCDSPCDDGCDTHIDADDNSLCDRCGTAFTDGCDNHADKNDDGVCDTEDCGKAYTDGCDNHRDADDDGVCDVDGCDAPCDDGCETHIDADDNSLCDRCGTAFTDGCDNHIDVDDNGKCDKCAADFDDGCDSHIDADDDGVCDNDRCNAPYDDGCDNHTDVNKDGVCDECGGSIDGCNHTDRNDNGECDKCGESFSDGCDNHRDADDDGRCDNDGCGKAFDDGCDVHVDINDDRKCDKCKTSFDDGHDVHVDKDDDFICDFNGCGKEYNDGCDNHRDEDDNGYCDNTYYCSEEYWDGCEKHRDADDDGRCDNELCGESFTDGCDKHRDENDDNKCDNCGEDFEDGCDKHRDADDDGKCDKCSADFSDGKEGEVTVDIKKSGSGITLTQTSVTAKVNEDLEIAVKFASGYKFDKSVPAGTYNKETGILTIPSFPAGTSRVTVYSKALDEYYFSFEGSSSDTCSLASGDFYIEGTTVTLKAGDTSRQFAGWSYGKLAANGGSIFSTEREFTFELSRAVTSSATSLKIAIYANYIDGNVYYYDANGGNINTSSTNRSDTSYYTAVATSGKLKVTLGASYFNAVGAVASTFYDDGTFYRDGYVLKEYNTKADGTGDGYSLGAKFSIDPIDGTNPTLYCIWEKESAAADFTYKAVSIPRPSGVNESKAPYWVEDGIEITSYTGNDTTVAIPEKIDGKYVISIAAGAFDNKRVETLVMGRRMLRIQDGAFVNCSWLTTVYFPDGITYVTDSFIDNATRASLTTLSMNAVMPPKYSPSAWAGLFAIKLTRLMSTSATNRLIMIGGSSIYEGVASAYLEALINDDPNNKDYSFINFGTTRTLTIMLYFDAVDHYTKEGDMVIMSPENHARAMGDTSFVANSYDDAEGMYPSLMRYLDIRNFTDVFTSLGEFNLIRASRSATRYEEICKLNGSDAYGDDISDNARRSLLRNQAGCIAYTDTYIVTFNERIKSAKDAKWNDEAAQEASRDWRDDKNETWCSFNDPFYADQVNRMIREIKKTGATVYFAFAPVDGTGVEGSDWGVIPECKADPEKWLAAYDKLVSDTYELDGLIGKSSDYIYHHNYFYDNIYHLNNWGRAIRTYQFYLDLCDVLGIANKLGATAKGTDFAGCLFESDIANPTYKVDWLK